MNILNKFTIIVLTLLVVSCSSSGSSGIKVNSLTPDSKEGVVIGKIKVLLNGTNVTPNSILSFNGIAWGTDMLQIENEDYFLIKLPEGENSLKAVISKLSERHRGIRYFFPEAKSTFHIDRSKINYIGDITITWTGPDEGPSVGFAGPFSAYSVTTTSTGKADISTVNNINNVTNFLDENFPNDSYEINISLLGGETGQVEQEDKRVKIEKKEPIERQPTITENNIEKRLIYLKQLHEKKLITQKEYEEKRKEIIDDI